ncbi:hypothetical protein [Streptomyces sp. NPDC018031]|uniref:hypothetical protein n=1 Tax=Streptomyces sp. NPDC018031 TaxID=3365033 RepID=UPI0037B645ED
MSQEPYAPTTADPAARTGTPAGPAPAAEPASGGPPGRPRSAPEVVREALLSSADAARAVLAGADDGVLLGVLAGSGPDDGLSARRLTRVVDELVSRAGRRRPETADAVCREVLRSLLYVGRPDAPAGRGARSGGPRHPGTGREAPAHGPGEDDTRIRNAVVLYEGLVRPYADRGRTPELLAAALPRLWNLPGGAGREVVVRIVDGPGPAGFGESGWRALFLNVAAPGPWAPSSWDPGPWPRGTAPAGWPERGALRPPDRSRAVRATRGGVPGSADNGRVELQPGQLWVTGLLGVIAVALVLIMVLALA